MQEEVARMAEAARVTLGEAMPPPKRVTQKDKLLQFLEMPREQRQQLYAQMGPEQYAEFLTENLSRATELLGPRAGKELMAYMYADGAESAELDSAYQEAVGFLQMLAGPEAESFLEQELLKEEDE